MITGDRISRGRRVQEIQTDRGFEEDGAGFTVLLNRAAEDLQLSPIWTQSRLSKVRSGIQDLSIEDMTVIAYLDPKKRGWTWIAYGVAAAVGEDPYTVLSRGATKKPKGRTA